MKKLAAIPIRFNTVSFIIFLSLSILLNDDDFLSKKYINVTRAANMMVIISITVIERFKPSSSILDKRNIDAAIKAMLIAIEYII